MTEQSLRKLDQLQTMLNRGHGTGEQVPGGADAPNSMVHERVRKWILHYNLEHLHGPEEVTYAPDELVALCLVRNGRPYVRSFIDHYLTLGVKHVYFLDNGSTDGTVEALSEYENVTVFRSNLPFKVYQIQMKQYLTERFARDRWSLCVDIDELFEYPYSDVVSLSSFLNYLSEHSYTSALTQMLDMFPEEPVTDAPGGADEPLKERYKYYDITNLREHDYLEDRRIGGRGNTLANGEIAIYRGGIKKAVFPTTGPVLTKHALVFLDERTRPMDGNAHKVSNARVADITCVLLHYKFTNNLYESVRLAVQYENYMKDSAKHKLIMEELTGRSSLHLRSETSRELRSVNDLVHNQFLVVSREYMALVEDEECDKAQTASRDRPRRLVEALFETRAETRIRICDIERLEKQVEKLQTRLARNREEARKSKAMTRKLQQQLRNAQTQLSPRRGLSGKLGGLWARATGKVAKKG